MVACSKILICICQKISSNIIWLAAKYSWERTPGHSSWSFWTIYDYKHYRSEHGDYYSLYQMYVKCLYNHWGGVGAETVFTHRQVGEFNRIDLEVLAEVILTRAPLNTILAPSYRTPLLHHSCIIILDCRSRLHNLWNKVNLLNIFFTAREQDFAWKFEIEIYITPCYDVQVLWKLLMPI